MSKFILTIFIVAAAGFINNAQAAEPKQCELVYAQGGYSKFFWIYRCGNFCLYRTLGTNDFPVDCDLLEDKKTSTDIYE